MEREIGLENITKISRRLKWVVNMEREYKFANEITSETTARKKKGKGTNKWDKLKLTGVQNEKDRGSNVDDTI